MLNYHISDNGLKFTEEFEGFRSSRYQNPGDVPTIGYGTTAGADVVEPLPEKCTQVEAERWLELDMQRSIIPAIEAACVAGDRDFGQNEVDACCDIGYNLGAGIFLPTHTLGHMIRNRSYTRADIAQAFLLYDDKGTIYFNGLLRRREADKALFERGKPG